MPKLTLFYIPTASAQEAQRLGELLLKKKLVACTNSFPISSTYWWQGKLTNGHEYVLLAKTLATKAAAVEKEVKKAHSYTTPCIARFSIEVNAEYAKWAKDALR